MVRGGVIDVVAKEVVLLRVPGPRVHPIIETAPLNGPGGWHKVSPGAGDGRQVGSGSFYSGVHLFSSCDAALFLSSDWKQ